MADDKSTQTDETQEEVTEESAITDESKQEEESQAPEAEGEQEQEEQPKEVPAPQEEPEEKPPSRREQLRVQQLLKKYGPPPERVPNQSNRPDFRGKVNADEEVYKTLEDTTMEYGNTLVQDALSQADFRTWHRFLKMDDTQVRGKYDVLDPTNKEKFHPALADALNQRYLRFVGYNPGDASKGVQPSVQNPDISYLDFVEAEMEFADEVASQRIVNTTQNIARQAANAGLRPDGSSAKPLNLNKAPEDMTDAELKAAINASLPRDTRGRFASQK
jgi:hypothetical protein